MKNLFSILVVILIYIALAQNAAMADGFGIELLGLNAHIIESAIQWGDQYPRKLDATGRFVHLPGWEAYWQKDMDEKTFLNADAFRFTLANYRDSMDRLSGYIHAGLRWNFKIDSKRQWSLGFGPSLFFRESWSVFANYDPHQLLLESDSFLPGYEYMWLPFGDIDYQYQMSNKLKLVVSMIPAIPYSILLSVGIFYEN